MDSGDFIKVVGSSNIEAIGYDENDKSLYIEFKSGKTGQKSIYSYSNVEKNIFDELLDTSSKGKFIHSRIKGSYEYNKVE